MLRLQTSNHYQQELLLFIFLFKSVVSQIIKFTDPALESYPIPLGMETVELQRQKNPKDRRTPTTIEPQFFNY